MSQSAVYSAIPVVSAVGTGGTTLSAFHDALVEVDLGHYNLVRLSSVIPPGTTVDVSGKTVVPNGQWGDKMYCVYAAQWASEPGEQAWAGIGWVQRRDGKGGLFVEHEGTSQRFVEQAILTSLADLVRGREDDFEPARLSVRGATCEDDPICVMVIAPYEAVSWAGGR